ncbi:hypothetical protein DXB34_01930 [Phocaeicola vulgatus]|nr:hypothetical protein DXB34_01930 [Phocaeicola vulgatus]
MIPADAGSKHAVARTVRGHPGLQPLKGNFDIIEYRHEKVSRFGMILRTSRPEERATRVANN